VTDEPWVPLLVIDVPGKRWSHPVLALLLFCLLAIATALLAYFGQIPWLRRGAPAYLLVLNPAFWKLVLLPLGVVFAIVVARHVQARAGRVEFFVDRIAFSKREGAVEVHWSDLACFRDGSSDFVQLVRKGERLGSSTLTVPTASEEARVAVLALLDARGVPREE
jgi:hypothetical protein